MTAGYSGTPLAKKLGIKPGCRVSFVHEPSELHTLLDLPPGAVVAELDLRPDLIVAFFTEQEDLESRLNDLAELIFPDKVLWLAWPKQSSSVTTDLSGTTVRASVLATKLVDTKICAISDVWSGLKVVWRKEHR